MATNKSLLPLYHIYVECKEDFSWTECDTNNKCQKLSGKCHLFANNVANALINDSSSNEDILYINAQVTELFFVAIPNANFCFVDFLRFAQINESMLIGVVQIFHPLTKQISVAVKFKSIQATQQCFLQCHGRKYFANNSSEICHCLFAAQFEIINPSGKALQARQMQMSKHCYLQMPLCPNCLERLDPNLSSVWTHNCLNNRSLNGQHSENDIPTICLCTNRWLGIQCPVCRKIKESKTMEECKEEIVAKHKCCQKIDDLWLCLICGNQGCGRFKQSHALQHFKETMHTFCLKLTTLSIWDYQNDEWQHRLFTKRTFSSHDILKSVRLQNANQNSMDEYSRSTVMAKLENVHEFYNKMLFDVIQQQSANYDLCRVETMRQNESKQSEKRQIVQELRRQIASLDEEREAMEMCLQIKAIKLKNDMKRKEFEQIMEQRKANKKEMDSLRKEYDEKEQVLRQQKNRKKQEIESKINEALTRM